MHNGLGKYLAGNFFLKKQNKKKKKKKKNAQLYLRRDGVVFPLYKCPFDISSDSGPNFYLSQA